MKDRLVHITEYRIDLLEEIGLNGPLGTYVAEAT